MLIICINTEENFNYFLLLFNNLHNDSYFVVFTIFMNYINTNL